MRKRTKYIIASLTLGISVLYYACLPDKLFQDPYSTVLQARTGELLSASIATDGQWRFPLHDSIPQKFVTAIINYEDKRFFSHIGVDFLALGRAFRQNISHGRIISGGSTLSMQVIRLSRKNKSRTVLEKLLELVLATRLEMRYTKEEILKLYAAHAPFGGNVVGLEAASWRYYGRNMQELSWGEAALLAVLPNAPSLIHPGRNKDLLKRKRDALLDKLLTNGIIDAFTCSLAKEEPLPDKPLALPRHARHLLLRMQADGLSQSIVKSSVDYSLQQRSEQLVDEYNKQLAGNQVHNAAALILDVRTGNVLTYIGNTNPGGKGYYHNEVDIVASPRSTGSILKPFLYAAMLDEGALLPRTLLMDVPLFINGFSPRNFSHEYDGAVPANKALIRSLNVPAVNMLKEYRYEKFHTLLKNLGMTTLHQPPDHYGLTLILGGAEGTLWDITGMYASMARTLNNFFQYPGTNRYHKTDFHAPAYIFSDSADNARTTMPEAASYLSAASVYQTLQELTEVYRPGEETGWRYFTSSRKIAWKTGTSFGFRDAWAVGVTPHYVVGVWVGNADGEGRPGLTGTDAASPLMFSLFSQLPPTGWFEQPIPELQSLEVCSVSGYKASAYCGERDTMLVPKQGLLSPGCPYHQRIHLSSDSKNRITSLCAPVSSIKTVSWFVLPPVQEYYYKSKNISYKPLPPLKPGCGEEVVATMDLIYPKPNARVFIPRDLSGKMGEAIFELAHKQSSAVVYWHLDGEFIGATKSVHQMALSPSKGSHILTLIDNTGHSMERRFDVISGL
jgi:penicillin-binding protein 1C